MMMCRAALALRQIRCIQRCRLSMSVVERTRQCTRAFHNQIEFKTLQKKQTKHRIDSFGFPAGESSKAFCSRVKTLVHHYLRDVHVKWIIPKKSSTCSNIMGKMRLQFPGQWNDTSVYAMISSILRQKVCKLRKLDISGGKFLTYDYDICCFYFLLLLNLSNVRFQ
jgi:hypothetical protein